MSVRIIKTLYWDGTLSSMQEICADVNRDLFEEGEDRLTYIYSSTQEPHDVMLWSDLVGDYVGMEPFDSVVVYEVDRSGSTDRDVFVTRLKRYPESDRYLGVNALKEFHETFDGEGHQLTDEVRALSGDLLELRKTLIREEFDELMEALDEGDTEHIYKEMADLLYVVYGLDVHMGQRLDAVFKEVHKSNMSKVWDDGKVHRREDGKILKPPTYVAPDLKRVLS